MGGRSGERRPRTSLILNPNTSLNMEEKARKPPTNPRIGAWWIRSDAFRLTPRLHERCFLLGEQLCWLACLACKWGGFGGLRWRRWTRCSVNYSMMSSWDPRNASTEHKQDDFFFKEDFEGLEVMGGGSNFGVRSSMMRTGSPSSSSPIMDSRFAGFGDDRRGASAFTGDGALVSVEQSECAKNVIVIS